MSPQEQIVARFAPTGTLRAAINLGNPILAGSDPATGAPRGVSIDLARELGRRLGVAVELLDRSTPPASRSRRSRRSAPTSASSPSTRCAAPTSRSPRRMS